MQVPAYVEYEKATSVAHALALLARFGPEARILAGGHSLIPMMKLRLAQPETLIDINGLSELSYLTVTGPDGSAVVGAERRAGAGGSGGSPPGERSGGSSPRAGSELRIGALTRHAQLLDSAEAGRHFAVLHDAELVIADPVVRNWGTVGGSLCQADPSEDLSAAFAALKATMVIAHPGGTRTVPARDFHTGPYETVVAPGEILTEIRITIRPGGGSAYEKVGRRAGDWPVGAAASALWLDGAGLDGGGPDGGVGTIADAGIGLTAVGSPHFAAAGAEDFLRGAPATEESFARAGELAAASCRPVSDQRGPADYKRHLARELTIRSLRRALQRARPDGPHPAQPGAGPPRRVPQDAG
jgi:carbon-monoxide dehydrogenase medium subunit